MKSKTFRITTYVLGIIIIWMILSQFFIQKERWSDEKAYSVFKKANIPLAIHDTVIDNTHLHYALTGSDTLPTLIFIHGSPGSWMHYMKYLRDERLRKKYRIVAIDRPGFGYSSFGKAMHLDEQCRIIAPVLKSLKTMKPMILAGHSMGGPVAVKLASMEPNLFSKLVIIAGSIDANAEETETWRKIMSVKPLYWALPGAFGPSNTELLYLKKDLIPLQKDFSKVICDVLFIHGDADTWVPIKNALYGKKMMGNAASVRIDTIKNADHQIPWKNREELIQILLALEVK